MAGIEPFLVMGKSAKTSKASWVSELGESSTTGISTRNLGWVSFLSFLVGMGIGLLRGFLRVEERESFAWEMASSLLVGGREQSVGLCEDGFVKESDEGEIEIGGEGLRVVCKWSLRRLEAMGDYKDSIH